MTSDIPDELNEILTKTAVGFHDLHTADRNRLLDQAHAAIVQLMEREVLKELESLDYLFPIRSKHWAAVKLRDRINQLRATQRQALHQERNRS